MAKNEGKTKENSRWKKYKLSGEKVERTNQTCPKCGPGYFLAVHKDRKTCGKCGYSVVDKKDKK